MQAWRRAGQEWAEAGLASVGRRETLSEPPWRELAHLSPVLFLLPCSGAGGQHKWAMSRPAGGRSSQRSWLTGSIQASV